MSVGAPFVREGAIVPLNAAGDATGLGTPGSGGDLTVLVYPGPRRSTFQLTDEDGAPTWIASCSEADR